MAKTTKKASTKARDKRLRRTAQQTREAGLRTPVRVRLTPEERASLESYAEMRGMTLSEAIRSRACHYSPDGEKAAKYAKDLYYGMRENGAEMMESNRAVRIAYEESARKAFGLSVAVNRVGVNVNQIARRVNAGAVGDDAEAWLKELQYCIEILNEILEKGGVKEIRAIPPLMGGGADASDATSETARNEHRETVDSAPENETSKAPEKSSGKPVETVAKTDAKIESNARAETTPKTDAENAPKRTPETTRKTSAKPTQEPIRENAVEQTVEAPADRKTEQKPAARRTDAHDKGSVVNVMARPMPSASPASGTEGFGPRRADPSKGESQAKLDQEWIESLLAPKSKPRHNDGDGEISDEMRERIELMVSYDMPSDVTGRK